jgi:proteasome lid subunit RPN8/RPN11
MDRLRAEAMTGLGAIPRRGAEIGGLLIGRIEDTAVYIDDFEAVPCEYRQGPSYVLSDNDQASFEAAYERWKTGKEQQRDAVGYFRSNTRDRLALSDADRQLMRRYFPSAPHVMLLIRPYVSRVTVGGFVAYEDGVLGDAPHDEFPFVRDEPVAPRRRRVRGTAETPLPRPPAAEPVEADAEKEAPAIQADTKLPAVSAPARRHDETNSRTPVGRRLRIWAVTCAVLLLGALGGFTAAVLMVPRQTAPPGGDPYSLSLSVSQTGDSLHLRWDRQSRAVRSARRGALEIADGASSKTVDLDDSQLHNGSVIYHSLTDRVIFRLVVYPREGVEVRESIEWRQ